MPGKDKVTENSVYKSTRMADPLPSPPLLSLSRVARTRCTRKASIPGKRVQRYIIFQSQRVASVLLESCAFNMHRISKGVAPENGQLEFARNLCRGAGLAIVFEYSLNGEKRMYSCELSFNCVKIGIKNGYENFISYES